MVAASLDLIADRSLTYQETVAFMGDDFTGAAFSMKVRPQPDAAGAALVSLATVTDNSQGVRLMYAGTDTISNHISAGRLPGLPQAVNPATGVAYKTSDSVALSQLRLTILNTAMSAMPAAPRVGDALSLAYDLLVTPSGGFATKQLYGAFVVRPTVSQ